LAWARSLASFGRSEEPDNQPLALSTVPPSSACNYTFARTPRWLPLSSMC
jgi:hypothetical protein